jgi:hypothetical protein
VFLTTSPSHYLAASRLTEGASHDGIRFSPTVRTAIMRASGVLPAYAVPSTMPSWITPLSAAGSSWTLLVGKVRMPCSFAAQ